ncbi:thiol S-methyltransferase TMT1A-like [Macrobrachium rosenbergii]|uniref:thiol S-methyltransferase TMT1A-like n=1 Tax=Macrobrachium rosenbergii TaxID=79674 RepID=UPI0034D548E6
MASSPMEDSDIETVGSDEVESLFAEEEEEEIEQESVTWFSWLLVHANTFLYIFLFYWIVKKIVVATKDRWCAYVMHLCTRGVFVELDLVKKAFFDSLSNVVSNEGDLRNKNAIRILEIGPGTGVNFAFYPEGSHLVVVDPNPYYKDYYYANIKKFSHIHPEEFHIATGEDMSMVPDNSIDVVVVTLVLCTVRDVDKTLSEIKRVLAPGGKFYFMEHITEFDLENHAFRRKLQHIFTHYIPVWPFVFDGCQLDRDPLPNIEKAGFSKVDAERYYAPVPHVVFDPEKPNLKGVATK